MLASSVITVEPAENNKLCVLKDPNQKEFTYEVTTDEYSSSTGKGNGETPGDLITDPQANNSSPNIENEVTSSAIPVATDSEPQQAPQVIPEIDELERRLAALVGEPQDELEEGEHDAGQVVAVEAARNVIRQWVRELKETRPATGSLHQTDLSENLQHQHFQPRRWRKDIEPDEVAAREWVRRLNVMFEPLEGQGLHLNKITRDYGLSNATTASDWKNQGSITIVGHDKNRIILDEKEVAIATTIHYKFGGMGRKMVKVAMSFYKELES